MTPLSPEDLAWLDRAADLARPLLGTTAENPTVGAILVGRDSAEIAHGVTAPGGRPHAEILALEQAGGLTRGATLYVTLEPCSHWGRTPPCTDAVIRAGIARVVVGIRDPDRRSGGKGIARLAASGLDVAIAEHAGSQGLHEGHLMRARRGRPFVIAKLAVSADGKVGLPTHGPLPIVGAEAQEWIQRQRATVDATMIGGATARIDNPSLAVRIPGLERRTPRRVILVGRKPIDRRVELIGRVSPFPVLVLASENVQLDLPPAIERVTVPGRDGRPILSEALKALAQRGIARLLVEGGPVLIEKLLVGELVDRFHLLSGRTEIGPRGIPATGLGTIEARLEAARFRLVDEEPLGPDRLYTYEKQPGRAFSAVDAPRSQG